MKFHVCIYIKTAPTCFGVTVTPSSGSALNFGLKKISVPVAVTQTCLLGLNNFHIRTVLHLDIIKVLFIGKGKSVPVQAWSGPEGSSNLTFWRRNYFFNFSTPCI